MKFAIANFWTIDLPATFHVDPDEPFQINGPDIRFHGNAELYLDSNESTEQLLTEYLQVFSEWFTDYQHYHDNCIVTEISEAESESDYAWCFNVIVARPKQVLNVYIEIANEYSKPKAIEWALTIAFDPPKWWVKCEAATPPLCALLEHLNSRGPSSEDLQREFAQQPDSFVEVLQLALRDPRREVREAAIPCWQFGDIPYEQFRDIVQEMLYDPCAYVCVEAARFLMDHFDEFEASIAPLMRILENPTEYKPRHDWSDSPQKNLLCLLSSRYVVSACRPFLPALLQYKPDETCRPLYSELLFHLGQYDYSVLDPLFEYAADTTHPTWRRVEHLRMADRLLFRRSKMMVVQQLIDILAEPIKTQKDDRDCCVYCAVINAVNLLGQIGREAEAAIPALEAIVSNESLDSDPNARDFRIAAAAALLDVGGKMKLAEPVLRESLLSPEVWGWPKVQILKSIDRGEPLSDATMDVIRQLSRSANPECYYSQICQRSAVKILAKHGDS